MSCIVWGCSNSNIATADPSVHYYVFPKHPVIAQQWIQACGWPPDQIDANIAQVCSLHFDEDSYTTEVKIIDYITCYTKVLKFDAVPTLFLPTQTEIIIKDPKEELQEMIIFTVPAEQETELQVQNVEKLPQEVNKEKYKHIVTKEQLATLENCNKTIREKMARLENSIKHLRNVLNNQIETYKSKDLELSNLHHEYLKAKRSYLTIHEQKVLLSKVFSESQIKILSGKKKIYWSDDDMAVGYTIRHLSNRRCYMYLTKKLNFPLPAVSSIKRWMTLKNGSRKKSPTTTGSPKKDEESE
ncbi:uncharacterized protein LOC123009737 isoform X1 [Tribolium madens]|uniref:uncharacterized protein LOC123009737 isoform X1 n=1 Tax=Tribolium madens TaxID=41895 RepID=UPI001CF738B8|nr:uncharacterized protein LOC123009737 isoform X1 [Tribolium madens]